MGTLMRTTIFALSAVLALAACDRGTQGADATTEEAEAEGNVVGNSSVAPAPTESPDAAERIPSAIQGTWGLAPADCEPGRDATGRLTITEDKLEFYESVGTLDDIDEVEPTRVRASFDFTGEGMSWERDVVLDVQDDGATLIRRDYGTDAAPGPFQYQKCTQGD